MRENWIGNLAGPESSWMGEEGWKNKGWPTMKYTWGTLGAIATAGGYSLSTAQLYNMSMSGKATYAQARWWIWDGFSLFVGTYNTLAPDNNNLNHIGPVVDFVDLRRSPFSYMNWGFRGVDYYENLKK